MFTRSFKGGGSNNTVMFIQLLHKKSCIDASGSRGHSFSMPEDEKADDFKKDSVNTFSCQLQLLALNFPALSSVF